MWPSDFPTNDSSEFLSDASQASHVGMATETSMLNFERHTETCSRQNNASSKEGHVLIPGTFEYATLQGQGDEGC